MKTAEIKKMSTIERLQAMEDIWDALLHDEIEIESPEWHHEVLAERKRKLEQGTAEFISIADVKENYRK